MDLRHISAFVAVAEERSFTRASRRLHISQPPLSRHVRQLEEELGVVLFVRRRDGIELTAEGRVLLEKARMATTAIADLQGTARSVKDQRTRGVSVGIGWGLWNALDRIRAHHAKKFPEMRISADNLCSERGTEGRERQFDIVLLRTPLDEAQYESDLLFEERFIAIVSSTHPLASRKSVRLSELASDPLLMYERCVGPAVYDKTLALCTTSGIRLRMLEAQPPPYAPAAMMLVASRQGFYIGIASPFTQTHRASGVAVVPLDEPNARLEVRICWRKNESSRNVREFLRSARDVFPGKRDTARSGAA